MRVPAYARQLFSPLSLKTTYRIAQERYAPAYVRRQVRIHCVDVPFVRLFDTPKHGTNVAAVVSESGEHFVCRDHLDTRQVDVAVYARIADGDVVVGDEGGDINLWWGLESWDV